MGLKCSRVRCWLACTAAGFALLAGWQSAYGQVAEACCFPSGGCQMMDPSECQQVGGIPGGAGSTCDSGTCIERPCCLPNGSCAWYSPQYCESIGGIAHPLGSSCSNLECPPVSDCAPTPDGLRCTNSQCPASGEHCAPRCATFLDGKLVKVEECDCSQQGECRVAPPPAGSILPQCEGSCPPGTVCNQQLTTNADGSVTICCECIPEPPKECRPNEDRTACEGPCPDPTADTKCVARKLHFGPNGTVEVASCDCQKPELCHPELTSLGPVCVGACPDGTQNCEPLMIPTADGGFDFTCRCQPCDPAQCDDGDPCTKDYCDPFTGGCRNDPIVCDDGDPCTIDRCVNGQCVFTPSTCDDHNPCTEDKCVDGKCVFTPKNCDDGDPCTIDYCDGTGSCRHEPDPACYCRPTEDGKRCNEAHCENSDQRCQPRCINVDPQTGEWTIRRCDCVSPDLCHAVPPQPGALMPSCEGACPPGMTCERREIPQADGTITICCNCIPEQPEECRPNAEKTGCEGNCKDPTSGQCVPSKLHINPDGTVSVIDCDCRNSEQCHPELTDSGPVCVGACPDSNMACNRVITETPDGGIDVECRCEPCTPEKCDDGDPCTKDYCDDLGNCVNEPINCDDGDPCTEDVCVGGVCFHILKNCDDGDPCTKDSCDPNTGQCRHDPIICDDGNPCTLDRCVNGQCVYTPIVCDDGDPCTTDKCVNGQCVYTPIVCDDNNPCTVDRCVNGQCVYTPKDCDDGDPCTIDFCDPNTGQCRHQPNPECQACCFPSGAPCQFLPPNLCQQSGGIPQGPGSDCSNVECTPPNQVPKFRQPPGQQEREDIASNINFHAPDVVNKIVTDDFRSDGRPITSVRWWGSYLDKRYAPAPYGTGQSPYQIDGWLISFHRPLGPKPPTAERALGIYFAPREAVQIILTNLPHCDGHEVFEYRVDISKCCLIESNPDVRVPATDPWHCPAQPDAFRERNCYRYSLGIQAVVGMRWGHTVGTACCTRQPTHNFAQVDFWGWHATEIEANVRPALQSRLSPGPVRDDPCVLGECPPDPDDFYYGPWNPAAPVCPFPHRINMAFELWTNTTVVPPPCPIVVISHATSIKKHGTVGDFGIDLPLDPASNAGVECRSDGVTLMEVVFTDDIMADDGSLDAGDEVTTNLGTITGLSIAGPVLTIEMTGVPDRSCLEVIIENGPDGITTLGSDPFSGDNDIHVRNLFGDVNGNGAVNAADIGFVKFRSGSPVDNTTFKTDLNANGAINAADIGLVKFASGGSVSCP